MDTSRRDLLIMGSALTALAATAGHAAIDPAPAGLMEVLHIHTGPDGLSRASRVTVYGNKPIPVVQITAGSIGTGLTNWGTAPQKRFSINTVGDLDVELGDGTHHRIGKGDLVFIEDQGGKGHRSNMLTPVANLFIIVPDDFDLLAWAGTPPAAG
ncbi:hypothetical protein [Sphingobium nicotianae]|uniref:Cupin domain-containing protein n=1 Tax=Sphingobium nicotianae TaxID=2782607 RepID=A0A9X1DCN7_9SPHN|nr:hypothetical protein [Sphingobium nicotianae]MBT2187553.1 hypothetical protein [Sphingobium nicotianae]